MTKENVVRRGILALRRLPRRLVSLVMPRHGKVTVRDSPEVYGQDRYLTMTSGVTRWSTYMLT